MDTRQKLMYNWKLKLNAGMLDMGRSPNYGKNSNILIPDPYH
jgi:hypothetical protein